MSSDTFHIHLLSIEGDTAELQCSTSTAGGINDYAITRSFALMALEDGMGYSAKTPLQQGIAASGGKVWEDSFHREHVGKFIAKTEILRRIGIVRDERAWREGRFSDDDSDVERDFPLHKFILRVKVTDPKYLKGLKVGSGWGTTAYDAWWDDPLRPSKAAMAAVDRAATYWTPGGQTEAPRAKKAGAKKATAKATAKKAAKKAAKKTTAKKAAKKTTAKKAAKKAAKKTTAKKATVKKAAKKTTAKKTTAKKTTAKKTTAKKTAAKRARG